MGVKSKKVVLLSGVLCEKEGTFLLVQEAEDKPYSKCKDKWTIPHGSYDTEEESIRGLAKRELLEETGGTAVLDGRIVTIEGWDIYTKSVFLVCITWFATGWKKVQERWGDEIKNVQFFSKKEIQELKDRGQVRDDMPILDIINQFDENSGEIVRWELSIT